MWAMDIPQKNWTTTAHALVGGPTAANIKLTVQEKKFITVW